MVAPLVTVGIPVYNGERHLEECANAILNQTQGDLELVIADNASTDGTARICEQLAAKDPRVRVLRHVHNLGAPGNWNSLVDVARGRFFKWQSANDVCDPGLLQACVDALESDASAVLAYARTMLMDDDGRPIGLFEHDLNFDSDDVVQRFTLACRRLALNNPQCGLIRTEVLRRTRLDRYYPSGDLVLTAELALHGKLLLLPGVLNYRRQSASTFSSMLTPQQLLRLYRPGAIRPIRFIKWRRHLDNGSCVLGAPIGPWDKVKALGSVLRMAVQARRQLWGELVDTLTGPQKS